MRWVRTSCTLMLGREPDYPKTWPDPQQFWGTRSTRIPTFLDWALPDPTRRSITRGYPKSGQIWNFLIFLAKNDIHRVLRGLSTYPKNIRTIKHAFFGAKPHVEQRLLKAFCPLWDILANSFGKKPFGLLSKVLEGRQIEKSLLSEKDGKSMF